MIEDKDKRKRTGKAGRTDEKLNSVKQRPRRGITPTGSEYLVWREWPVKSNRTLEKPKEKISTEDSSAKTAEHDKSQDNEKHRHIKLWIRETGDKKSIEDKPPAGYEKHKDIPYKKEEVRSQQREKSVRQHKETANIHGGKMTHKRPRTSPRTKPSGKPYVQENLEPIDLIYTIGMGKMPMQKLLQKLVDNDVQLVVDLRSGEEMIGPGITKDRDLAILLKEAAGIEYRHEEILLPGREILEQYFRDKNWTRFSETYLKSLHHSRPDMVLSRELFTRSRVAFLGDLISREFAYRRIAAEYLADRWKIKNIVHL